MAMAVHEEAAAATQCQTSQNKFSWLLDNGNMSVLKAKRESDLNRQ